LIIKACAAVEPVEKRGSSLLFAADKHRKKQKRRTYSIKSKMKKRAQTVGKIISPAPLW
jgi:hypothetical protein